MSDLSCPDMYARLRRLADERKDVMVSLRLNRLHESTGRPVDPKLTKQLEKELVRIDALWADEETRRAKDRGQRNAVAALRACCTCCLPCRRWWMGDRTRA